MFFVVVGIVTAVVLVALWVLGLFLGAPVALLAGISASVCFIAVLVIVVRQVRAARLGRRLGEALVAQGHAQANQADAARKAAVSELQSKMRAGIASLKKSRLGARGGSALYALPWYIIVGPPGAGKTTAIRCSGLVFPLQEGGSAQAFRGVGGTRNCDFWFTNEAILLDTAGRYATSDNDQEEWLSFLDLLRSFRPKRPLNGLIVAISITDIAGATDDAIHGAARKIRARLDEIATRLKSVLPIYVVFTKVDLIEGFVEEWNDLRKSERGQAWGMGFTLAEKDTATAGELFARELEGLVKTLHARTMRRLAGERNPVVRRNVVPFPLEFAALKGSVSSFVDALFQKNTYQETPLLRGVYFTSGTQEGTPTARLSKAMAQAYQLPTAGLAKKATEEARSFFLTDVFHKVLFADAALATDTESERQKRFLWRVLIAGLASLLATSLALPALVSFFRNRELGHEEEGIALRLQQAKWDDPGLFADGLDRLGEARLALENLKGWEDNGAPVQLRWGMYTGSELYEGLRNAYATAVQRAFVQKVKDDLEIALEHIDAEPTHGGESFNGEYDALKLYLMLTDGEHADPAWGAARILERWQTLPHDPAKPEIERGILESSTAYLDLLARKEVPPLSMARDRVEHVRRALRLVPIRDRLYSALVRDANRDMRPIDRRVAVPPGAAQFVQSRSRDNVRVPGAYTKEGWRRVRSLLGENTKTLAAEWWVLAGKEEEKEAPEKLVGELRAEYFDHYTKAWEAFLRDLYVKDPGSAEVAVEELGALTDPDMPYKRILRLVADNVVIPLDEDKSLLEKVADKATDEAKKALDAGAPRVTASAVERAFKPMLRFGLPAGDTAADDAVGAGLGQYRQILTKLASVLGAQKEADTPTDPKQMSEACRQAFESARELLVDQSDFTKPLLSPLLLDPITHAWGAAVKDAGKAAGGRWLTQVWPKWHDKLAGKYPFEERGKQDAVLADVSDFFQPTGGALWSFYEESLRATIDRNGTKFQPSRQLKAHAAYTGLFLDNCLGRGAAITEALFPPKSDQPSVTFDVNLHSVSADIAEVTLEVDGATHTYRNEPQRWIAFAWPGKGNHGARLAVKGAGGVNEEILRPGDFGLFRLLDMADVRAGAPGKDAQTIMVATWKLRTGTKGSEVKLDLRPSRTEHPLVRGYFGQYQCPSTISGGQ